MEGSSAAGMQLTAGAEMPRALSIPRTTYSIVHSSPAQGRRRTCSWVAVDTPSSSVYVPLWQGAGTVALPYQIGSRAQYSHESAWWGFSKVAHSLNHLYSLKNAAVQRRRRLWMDLIEAHHSKLEADGALTLSDHANTSSVVKLQAFQRTVGTAVHLDWKQLDDELTTRFNDGSVTDVHVAGVVQGMAGKPMISSAIGYPAWYYAMGKSANGDPPGPKWELDQESSTKAYGRYKAFGPGPYEDVSKAKLSAPKPIDYPAFERAGVTVKPASPSFGTLLTRCDASERMSDIDPQCSCEEDGSECHGIWLRERSAVERAWRQAEAALLLVGVPEQTVNVWQSVRSENKMMPEMMEGPEPPGGADGGKSRGEVVGLDAPGVGPAAGSWGFFAGLVSGLTAGACGCAVLLLLLSRQGRWPAKALREPLIPAAR